MVKYSIIVPAYNEEKNIAKCLASLASQSYRNYEIIVVNNNSKDKTAEVAKRFTKKVYLEKKQGYIFAVNSGVKRTNGKYISICDADTIYPKSWLEKVNTAFEKGNPVGVYGGVLINDANWVINLLAPFFYDNFLKISKILGLDNTSGFNFVFRKDVFEKIGGYDESYKKASPDIELGKKLKRYGKLKMDLSIKVYGSSRRFRKKGFVKTGFMFFKLWIAKVFNLKPKMSYKDYNS